MGPIGGGYSPHSCAGFSNVDDMPGGLLAFKPVSPRQREKSVSELQRLSGSSDTQDGVTCLETAELTRGPVGMSARWGTDSWVSGRV